MESRWDTGGLCTERPSPPDEAMVRERCLGKGVDAPDLLMVKDFRFHAASSSGKIVELPTADSVNAFAEWFFAGLTRVTGTPTIDEDRSEVYDGFTSTISTPPPHPSEKLTITTSHDIWRHRKSLLS